MVLATDITNIELFSFTICWQHFFFIWTFLSIDLAELLLFGRRFNFLFELLNYISYFRTISVFINVKQTSLTAQMIADSNWLMCFQSILELCVASLWGIPFSFVCLIRMLNNPRVQHMANWNCYYINIIARGICPKVYIKYQVKTERYETLFLFKPTKK